MAANIQSDSTGKLHYMLTQDLNYSCAMACCAMAYTEYNQFCTNDPESAMRLLSKQFPGSLNKKSGTTMANASDVLTAAGVTNTGVVEKRGRQLLVEALTAHVKTARPAILAVSWQGGGGHAVLCVEVRGSGESAVFVIRDPWYGLQEVSAKLMTSYTPGCSLSVKCSSKDKLSVGNFTGLAIFTK